MTPLTDALRRMALHQDIPECAQAADRIERLEGLVAPDPRRRWSVTPERIAELRGAAQLLAGRIAERPSRLCAAEYAEMLDEIERLRVEVTRLDVVLDAHISVERALLDRCATYDSQVGTLARLLWRYVAAKRKSEKSDEQTMTYLRSIGQVPGVLR